MSLDPNILANLLKTTDLGKIKNNTPDYATAQAGLEWNPGTLPKSQGATVSVGQGGKQGSPAQGSKGFGGQPQYAMSDLAQDAGKIGRPKM